MENKLSRDQIDKLLDRRSDYIERLEKPDVPSDLRNIMNEYLLKTQDKVTGLQPRWALDEAIDILIKKDVPYAVSAIDFRNLGGLNTELNHEKTNEILREVAKDYLQKNVREWGGEVYRTGGDEFHAVVPFLTQYELAEKMKVLQEKIEKEVVEARGIANLPHKSQNGMPTGAGNIDYGCSDSSIKNRSEMLKVADERLSESKMKYLESIRIKEIDNNRLWEYNGKTKRYELSVDLSKEINHEHGKFTGKNEGLGIGRHNTQGAPGIREKEGGPGTDQRSNRSGRDGRGIREEKGRVLEEERGPAEKKITRAIVESLVKYAGAKHISVPENTQERWQKLLEGGESDANIRIYIDNYSKGIKGPDIDKADKTHEKPKGKEKEIGMDI